MHQGFRLIRREAFHGDLAFFLTTFLERQCDCSLDGVDGGQRRAHVAPGLARLLAPGGEQRRIRFQSAQLLLTFAGFRKQAGLRNFESECDRARLQVPLNDFVENAQPERFRRPHRFSRYQHVDGGRNTGEPRQPLRTLGSRNDAEIDFRLANLRIGARDPVMPCHRQLQAAAKSGSVQSHDHRFRAVLNLFQQIVQIRRTGTTTMRVFLELLNVGAGNERPSSANDNDGRHRGVLPGFVNGGRNSFRHSGRKRIHRGIVNCDHGHAVGYR